MYRSEPSGSFNLKVAARSLRHFRNMTSPLNGEGSMFVVNVANVEDLTCSCQDWKEHWLLYAGPSHPQIRPSNICSADGCFGEFEMGGRVRKVSRPGKPDPEVLIIPLCRSCGDPSNTKVYAIRPSTRIALADPEKTCRCVSLFQGADPRSLSELREGQRPLGRR